MLQVSIRLGRLLFGILLMVGGAVLALPGIPGPGLLLMFGGLALVGREFHWAHQIHEWLRRQAARMLGGPNG